MGIVKGGLLVIVSFLLFWSFLFANLFLTLTLSLSYENVQSEITGLVQGELGGELNLDQIFEESLPFMQEYCQNYSEFVFSQQGYTFTIPCDVINQGPEAVINSGLDSTIQDAYYRDYDCSFIDCLKGSDTQFYFISKQAKDYWNNKFYFSLIASLVLIGLAFLLIEKKTTLPILVGILLAASSLPLLLIDNILSNWTPSSWFEEFSQIFTVFFTKASTVFLISFILGIFILAVGVSLKFFLVGFKISGIFAKKDAVSKTDTKKIVKQEPPKKKGKK